MELRHLRYFVAVAEELHFGRAAARLFVTQSTLSVQIQQLEAEVGGPLLVRTSRSVELTESGRLLHAEARRTLDQADRAMQVARQSVLGEVGSVRIGFSGVAAFSGTLPADLRRFHAAHESVEIEIRELPPSGVLDELRAGSIDLGYLPDVELDSWAGLHRVTRQPIVLEAALREDHPLARKRVLKRTDLDAESLILPATHRELGTIADRLRPTGPAGGGELRFVPTTLGVLALAAAGLGVAIVPQDLSLLSMAGLVYRPIADVVGPDLVVGARQDETAGAVLAFLRCLPAAEPARPRSGLSRPAARGSAGSRR
jgi:DNA-binding transcriptional LysR family regulator